MFVTVLLSALNAEDTISEAIASVLSQTHKDFELILIDDGSTDRTLEIMQRFGLNDPRIRVVSHPNMGMGASLNAGLSMARARWVARMDADDVMIPNRLKRQLSFLRDNCGVTVASSLVYHIDDDGRLLGSSVSDLKTAADLARYVRNNETVGFHHPAVIMRRDVVLEIGGYRPQFWPADDIDLWTRIAEKGHLLLVQQEYLLKWGIHFIQAATWMLWPVSRESIWTPRIRGPIARGYCSGAAWGCGASDSGGELAASKNSRVGRLGGHEQQLFNP